MKNVKISPEAGKPKKRFLNIIYFIDSNKTRSFQLSLGQVNFFAFTFFVGLVWAFAAPFVLFHTSGNVESLRERLQDAMSTVFQYQSRYDGVFVNAYQITGSKGHVSRRADAKASYKDGLKNRATRDMPPSSEANTITMPTNWGNQSSGDVKDRKEDILVMKGDLSRANVSIQDPQISKDGSEVKLDLIIKNEIGPDKAKGVIWSKVYLKGGKSAKEMTLMSPSDWTPEKKLTEAEMRDARNYFSIRYYKPKRFTFSLPEKWSGWIEKFEVIIRNDQGDHFLKSIVSRSGKIQMDNITRYAVKKAGDQTDDKKNDEVN